MAKRITAVFGHYGSGKTEFSINYAIRLSSEYNKVALIDLDIANPYFRSREAQAQLENKGIDVYSNTYGYDITAELPAITAKIRAPLESADTYTVVDVGGDAAGARVVNQFHKYFLSGETDIFCVVNAKRPETKTISGAISHIAAIQAETGLQISGIVNNTHLLRETTSELLLEGVRFAETLSESLKVPVIFHTYAEDLFPEAPLHIPGLFPINLYMRPTWLDK